VNVRDIGGYRTNYGLEVMRGRLFRGDALSQLTRLDLEELDRLGLRTVIDFRTPGEVLLAGADRLPSGVELYHCSGGKDRAGWMTAIVLTVLGVPREVVLRDYLLSNDFHRTEYQRLRYDLVKTGIVADPELLRPIMEQSATYLGAAFEEAERAYGSFGRFVTHGLEISDAMLGELRQAMLGDVVPPEPVS